MGKRPFFSLVYNLYVVCHGLYVLCTLSLGVSGRLCFVIVTLPGRRVYYLSSLTLL